MTMFFAGLRVMDQQEGPMFSRRIYSMRAFMMLLWTLAIPQLAVAVEPGPEKQFEVWLVDQSNSAGKTFGGRISIFNGDDISDSSASDAIASAEIDLGADTAALCLAQTGANPVRPHMVFFNRTHSHGVLAFVASGHVVFFNAATRAPVACLRTTAGRDRKSVV